MCVYSVSLLNSLSASEMSMLQSLQAVYDRGTHAHAQRVMVLAEAVARELQLAARRIAVVDSYDAMVKRRVYHKPQSSLEACAELQRCAGSQFDPHIVTIFLSSLTKSGELQKHPMRIRAVGESELVGVRCAKLLLQSGEYVRVSA